MKKLLNLTGCAIMIGCLVSCSSAMINLNPRITGLMNAKYLNNTYKTKPIDLAAEGRCPGALTVKVVGKETRKDVKYIVYDTPMRKFYIVPDEFMRYLVTYMEEKLRESGLTIDQEKGKEIDIEIDNLKEEDTAGGWSLQAWASLKITLPDIKYTQVYSGTDASGQGENAVAYAIHLAVVKFLEDPVVQKYFQCRK